MDFRLQSLRCLATVFAVPESNHSPPSDGVPTATALAAIPVAPAPWAERLHQRGLALFLLTWAASSAFFWIDGEPRVVAWIDSVLLLSATASSLIALARRLPVQNVVMVAVVIALSAAGMISINAAFGVSFESFTFTDRMGAKLLGTLPWPVPLLWIVIVLNARGVAELILRPWRRTGHYGLWVLGLASGLAVLLNFGLEPFAVKVKGFWIWNSHSSTRHWHTAPWVNFLGWTVTSSMALLFSVPWLINKRPAKEAVALHPLLVWSLLNLWLALGHAAHQLWSPVCVTLAGSATVAILAVRGARSAPENK